MVMVYVNYQEEVVMQMSSKLAVATPCTECLGSALGDSHRVIVGICHRFSRDYVVMMKSYYGTVPKLVHRSKLERWRRGNREE